MTTPTTTNASVEQQIMNAPPQDIKKYVMKRYEDSINYYWKHGGINKRVYRRNRILVIVLGAVVTLLSSMLSASFIEGNPLLKTIFAIVTPAGAALLTIINGLTQSFQSGAAWRDMVLNAERLEMERDRFLATPDEAKDYKRELKILNSTILNESTAFFKRILDSEYTPDNYDKDRDR
ncbi:MAG TPA: DUF4231 domain-containing protein [Anaerolineales bacterium]|nr:DUF4231 domain-containing protein [Anaerolineales bacterium]